MSRLVERKGGDGGRETAPSAGESVCDGIGHLDQMRLCVGSEYPSPGSPSPSNDGIGLLSLPWEMVTRIASHLPAQCIINVLPQVCRVLGEVGEDSSAWQQRSQRLVGAGASFPAGPRDELDWPSACLEMEQLIGLWRGQRGEVEGGEERDEGGERGGAEGGEERGEERGGERDDGGERRVEGGEERDEGGERGGAEGGERGGERDEGGERRGAEGGEERDDGGERRGEREEGRERGGGERDEGRERNMPDGQERAREEAAEGIEEEQRGEAEVQRREDEAQRGEVEVQRREDETQRGEEEALEQAGAGGGEEEEQRREEEEEEEEEEERRRGDVCEEAPPSLERFSLPAGHIADVHSVLLFGGQGALCATGSRDRNVNLWDLRAQSEESGGSEGGRLLGTLGAHSGWVWCLAERANLLASGAFDSTVRLWDLGAGGGARARGVITGRAPVICLSWQPDGLLAGSHDKKISIYDHRIPQPLVKSVQVHSSAVLSLVADDRYIISGGKDNTVALYDRRAAKLVNRLTLGSFLLSMSYSGQEVWAGDNQGRIHSFSLHSGALRTLGQFDVGHTHLVTGIHCSPGSLYTCSSDRTIRVHLPSAPPRTLCTLRNPTPVNGLSVEAGVLAVASGNMAVEVWRPPQ